MLKPELVPSVDFPLVIQGEGTLRRGDHSIPITNLRLARSKYRYDQPWDIELRIGTFERGVLDHMLSAPGEYPWIEGAAYDGGSLHIAEFRWQKQSGNRINGSAFNVRQGIVALPKAPDEMFLTAYLTDNALALPLADSLVPGRDGSRKAEHPRPAAQISTKVGQARFWLGDVQEKVTIGGRQARSERSQTVFQVKLSKQSRETPLPVLIERLQTNLDDFTKLLSFLSRRHVGCYRISAVGTWKEADAWDLHEGELWQHAPEPLLSDRPDSLVNPRRMPRGSLNHLYQQYCAHPRQELIARATIYLVEAFHQRFIESKNLYAFTAFEAIVNGLEETAPGHVMDIHTFRKLRSVLELCIRNASSDFNISKSQRRDLYAKLGELQRRPLIPRALEILHFYRVEWEDLWPGVQHVDRALGAAYARRSAFIHAGHLRDPAASARDAIRIACLTERIMYALLGADSDWLSPVAYMSYQQLPHDTPSSGNG